MVTGFVTDIDVVVSGARILARTAARHADVVPTVMPVPDGIVVGAPVGPTQPSVYALTLDSAWIGFEPAPIPAAAASDAIVDKVLGGLAPTIPGAAVGVAHPSAWTGAQQEVLSRSFGRYSGSVVLESLAVRVAKLRQSLATSERIIVVEIEPLDLTVTAVDRSRDQIEIAACESEPTLGAGEWNDAALDRTIEMISLVSAGVRPTTVVVIGPHEEALLERLRGYTAATWTTLPTPLVQPMAYTALLLPQSKLADHSSRPIPAQNAEWVGTLRERAAATAPSPRMGTAKIAAAAAVAIAVFAAGSAAVIATRSGGADAATSAGSMSSGTIAISTTTAPTPAPLALSPTQPVNTPTRHTMGRVGFTVPPDWRVADGATSERTTIVPKTATPARITVTYNTVADQAGYDEVLRDITARIARAEPGRFGTPERDVVFAGRRGIGYQELPGDGSVVRWYVLLDHGVQTNVGCQHGSGGWGTVSTACEEVMRTVAISP
ncbi:type VII secretion-associated protein [Nocardia asteroides]|uniref:type VII secretion-associated protein n=1 Tax=Nocardia asteroides TaxID=1824 RepID=UPI0033C0D494